LHPFAFITVVTAGNEELATGVRLAAQVSLATSCLGGADFARIRGLIDWWSLRDQIAFKTAPSEA